MHSESSDGGTADSAPTMVPPMSGRWEPGVASRATFSSTGWHHPRACDGSMSVRQWCLHRGTGRAMCSYARCQGNDPQGAARLCAHNSPLAWRCFSKATPWRFRSLRTIDAAVMALVIFFVPEPAKAIAEMARVVRPGGLVTTYAWDIAGRRVPARAHPRRVGAVGLNPARPPASWAHREWTRSARAVPSVRSGRRGGREITVARRSRQLADDLRRQDRASSNARRQRYDVRRRREAQEPGARAPLRGYAGTHYLRCTRPCDKGATTQVACAGLGSRTIVGRASPPRAEP